jgi:hypothetical protein
VQLSYERLSTYFAERAGRFTGLSDELAARARFRREVIEQSITKSKRGETMVPDGNVTDFWRAYWQLATQEAPELRLSQPGSRPSRSLWASFRSALADLPDGPAVLLRHKTTHAFVDLEIAGVADRLSQLKAALNDVLPKGAELRLAGKSVAVSIGVWESDPSKPFDSRRASVAEGLRVARLLQDWWNSNVQLLGDRIRAAIDPEPSPDFGGTQT